MEVLWDCLRIISSRPYGTFRLSNFYPGLRPGLSSAVPPGLIFAVGRFLCIYGMAEAMRLVSRRYPLSKS
jgi:hypothetical protein